MLLAAVATPASLAFGASTTTDLTLSSSSVASGTVVTFTATVTTGLSTPVSPGLVTFCDASAAFCVNSAVLGTAQLTSGGTAVLHLAPAVGNHSYKAIFSGTNLYTTSTSSAQPLTVTGTYITGTTLTSTGTAGNPGYTLAAAVAAKGGMDLSPAAAVSFQDTSNGNYVFGTAPLGAPVSTQTFPAATFTGAFTATPPRGAALGDFKNNGTLDIAVASGNVVNIFLGTGTGTFAAATALTAGTTPTGVAVGDFNSDGILDIAVANFGSNNVSIFLGKAGGGFQTAVNYAAGTGPVSVAVGDFNNDGNADLAIANQTSNNVTILLNSGSGTFSAALGSPIAVGTTPTSLIVSHFNTDANLDIAVTNNGSNTVTILEGNSTGGFTQPTGSPFAAGTSPMGLVAGDFNGDGKIDLAICSSGDNTVSILLGDATKTFKTAVAYAAGTGPTAIALADFNGDGNADLTVINPAGTGNQTQSVLLGNGDGTFGTPASFSVGANGTATLAGDFNSDGFPDIATPTPNPTTGNGKVSILLDQITQTAQATLKTPNVPEGAANTHNVDAAYPGETFFKASTSTTIALTGTPISTLTLLGTNPSTTPFGQQVVLSATLTPFSLGNYTTNNDLVTFLNGTTVLGTSKLTSGVATLNVTSLPGGTDSLTASYNLSNSDKNFLTSTSSPVPYSVTKATPVITWPTPAPINYGTLVSPVQENATTTVAGTFAYSIAPYTLLQVGTYTLNVTFTPSAANSTSYNSATSSVTLVVNQAVPQINWPSPAPITFPTPLSNIQLDATVAVYTPVPLTSYYNINAINSDGRTFSGGFDQSGNSYSANLLGTSVTWNNITYQLGPANAPDAVAGLSSTGTTLTIPLPAGFYASINLLGAMVNNTTSANPFIITYTDGTTSTYTQSLSDWVFPQNFAGESEITCVPYRNTSGGGQDAHLTCVYGYQIPLNSSKIAASITLPAYNGPGDVSILAMDMVSPPILGNLVYNPVSGTVLPTGENTLNANFTPTDTTNYTSATASVPLLVNPASSTVIVWPTPAPITYGTPLSSTQLNAVAETTPSVTSVSLSSYYRVNAFQSNGSVFSTGGFDNAGNAYSSNQVGTSITWNGQTYSLGPANLPDAVTSTTIALPQGVFTGLTMIGAATTVGQTSQRFTITYTDGTTAFATISLDSWTPTTPFTPVTGESIVSTTTIRNTGSGGSTAGTTYLYGYQIPLDNTKTVQSITLPNNRNVVIVAMALNTAATPTVIPGSYVYTPPAGTVLPAGTNTLSVQFTPTNPAFGSATGSVNILVTKQTLLFTANNETVVYGTAVPPYTYTVTGYVNGDTASTAYTGNPSLTTTPASPTTVNNYTITAGPGTLASSNYSLTFATGILSITKATPVITWANPADITYGTALVQSPAGQLNATASVGGAFSYSPAAGTILSAGPHTLTVTFTPTDTVDYTTATASVQINVDQRALTVTASSYTIPYGTADPTYAATISGFVNGDTAATATTGSPSLTTTPAVPSAPNTYTITAAAGTLASANYTFNYVNGSLTITKGTLTVTAGSATRVYGAANPTFTATATGAMNSDTFTFSETTTATATSPVGTYNIVPTASGANLGNYNVVYVNGTLTVTKANLAVTANSYTIAYGTADPTYTATISGFVNGDTTASATTGSPSLTTTPAAPSAPNTYTITAAAGSLTSTNYTFTYVNGSLTITKGTLTVTAGSATRAYGAANPTFTATATGAMNSDTFTFSETTTATVTSPAGTYNIVPTASGANLGNYTVVYVNGTLTVTKANVTVTANSYTIPYGTADPTYTATITGFLNGDTTASATTGSPSLTTTPAAPSAPNTYTITAAPGTLASTNYTFTYVNGSLTINKGILTVTAGNATRVYGAANPTFSATATGAMNGDTFTFSETTTATATSPVGTYNIVPTASGTNLGNYTVVYVNGTLSITKANLVVTANSYTVPYGTADPTYTATISGFLNSDTQANSTTGTPSLTTAPAAPTAAGIYTITAAAGTLASTNYTFTYTNGSLTINKGTLTVTAGNATRVYGAANPTFSATATGAMNGDTFTFSETTTATATSPVGAYNIVPTASGTNLGNYTVVYVNGTLTVTPAVLTVTANSYTIPYGTADPTYTATISGFLNSDTQANSTTGTPSLTTTPAAPATAGVYTITAAPGTLASTNYTFTYTNGSLTINKGAYTITWKNQSAVYGTALGSTTLTATASIPGSFTYSPAGVLQVGPAVPVIAT
ncbi:beta strand repeat-containing protein, partial [Tunturiibacter psychrotolerans]